MTRPLLALSTAAALAAATGGAAAQQAATPLEEITVQGQGAGTGQTDGAPGVATNDGYVAKTTRSATKTDMPVNETPATINTVTQQQLQDRRPQTLEDALAYTPGARVGAYGFNPRFDSFFIRGVDVTYTGVFRDGLRQYSSPSGMFRLEPYGVESISILKGGASAIYGASSSVGIIDVISKRPTDYKFGEVEVQGGSFDRKQLSFDLGGPVNEQGTVTYRLTGLARDADTDMPGVPDNRVFIAPAVTFKPSDDTKITVLGEYMDSKTGGSMFQKNSSVDLTDKYGNVIKDANGDPVTGSGGAEKGIEYDPDYNGFTQKQWRAGYEFEHDFSDAVSLHQNFRWSGISTNERFGDADKTYRGQVKETFSSVAADTYLKTKLQTGPVGHTVLTGVDFGHLKYDSRIAYGGTTGNPDLPNPTKQHQTLWGVYAQDEIRLDAWRLLLSGRHDWLDSKYYVPSSGKPFNPDETPNPYYVPSSTSKQNKGAWTGRAGLSYVTPFGLTPYVSYGTSFNANSGTVINDGSVAKPTKGEQAEAGVKYAVPGYNASIDASVFWLKQTDGIIYAVDSHGVNQQKQLDFRSRGFEIEAVGSLDNGVSFQASYSYTDTKILKLSDVTEGNQVNSIPKHAFAIWGNYDFQSAPLRGLGVGAGVRYTGSSFGDDLNRPIIKNSPRAFVDAKVSYEFENIDPKLKGLRLQVNANNLLDKVEQVCSGSYCYFNEGRKVIASLRYRW
ncbi:TonB-dependent siderophore receptor [Hansschlegelia plantiphila]|uniref:Ligand-gated channel n=1 Tax=Hansschlegelia plantiphila TaxID=374655 RepID=A0A9W6J369_9HYPH|nr:TonB-dependent siderophore receptor [Hansschlegelia plantiphila]GLK68898.1 ligand-gated channel [Hansschlegelia plantiphila]